MMKTWWHTHGVRYSPHRVGIVRFSRVLALWACVLVIRHARQGLAFLTPHRLLCGTLIHSPPTTAWPSKCYSIARTSFTAAKSPPEQQQRNPLALCRRQRRRHTRVRRRRGSLFSLAMRTTARHNRLQQKEDGEAVELDVEESPRVRLDGNGKGKGRIENDQDVVGERKSVLGKAGDAAKTAFNAIMAAATLASVALAAETIWELHGTPLTFANAVPILTKLLPLTGIGVFGVVQLVGLVARIVRVVLTLPIMISGIWVILQNVPQLLPKGSDLSGAGSLVAILATPEVLEAAAALAVLGGMLLWTVNVAMGAVAALGGTEVPTREDDDK